MGKAKVPAIFAADGSVRLKVGDPAPTLSGKTIVKLGEPCGDAVLATLATKETVLYGGLISGDVKPIALSGQQVGTGGATIKKFLSFDGNGSACFFLAQINDPLPAPHTSTALLTGTTASPAPVILAYTGQTVGTAPITSLGTLVALKGTLAEGRWRAAGDQFGVQLGFPGKLRGLYMIPSSAAGTGDWTQWLRTHDAIGDDTAAGIGFPGFGDAGLAALIKLNGDSAATNKSNATVVARISATETTVLARQGFPVPDENGLDIAGARFKSFGDPVSGAGGKTAFMATIAGVKGTAGIWYAANGVTLKQLARAGVDAPGSGKWVSFGQLVLPDGSDSGPIFTGKLKADKAAGISGSNADGLWAVNSLGELKLILRTGQAIDFGGTQRTVKSFTALTTSMGSAGAAHGYDDAGHVAVKATFTDWSQALLLLTIP